MKSIEWIDRLISERKLPSDRQAALLLGMSSALMSNHRNAKAVTLDDKYAYRLEAVLNLPHGTIVLDQHAEREKDPQVSAMWRKIAGAIAMTFLLGATAPLSYISNSYHSTALLECILCKMVYWRRKISTAILRYRCIGAVFDGF